MNGNEHLSAADLSRVDFAGRIADVLAAHDVKAPDLFSLSRLEWELVGSTVGLAAEDLTDAMKALVHHRLQIRAELEGRAALDGLLKSGYGRR